MAGSQVSGLTDYQTIEDFACTAIISVLCFGRSVADEMHASVLSVPAAAAICHDCPPEPQPLTAPAETGSRNSPSQNSQTKPQANRPAYQRTASQTEPTTNQIVIQPKSRQQSDLPTKESPAKNRQSDQPTNQPTKPATKTAPTKPSADRPADQPSLQPTKPPANQTIIQPSLQPANQTESQPTRPNQPARPPNPISGPCRR